MDKHALSTHIFDALVDTLELQILQLSVLFEIQIDILFDIVNSDRCLRSSLAQLYVFITRSEVCLKIVAIEYRSKVGIILSSSISELHE